MSKIFIIKIKIQDINVNIAKSPTLKNITLEFTNMQSMVLYKNLKIWIHTLKEYLLVHE